MYIALKFSRKQGDHVAYLYEKIKSIKLQTFAFTSQRIIEFDLFITRSSLAYSVANNDRRFFRF